jgi:hypothetical protein
MLARKTDGGKGKPAIKSKIRDQIDEINQCLGYKSYQHGIQRCLDTQIKNPSVDHKMQKYCISSIILKIIGLKCG